MFVYVYVYVYVYINPQTPHTSQDTLHVDSDGKQKNGGVIPKIAIIGSGLQARFQLKAMSEVRSWSQLHVWSPNPLHLEAYVSEMKVVYPDREVIASTSVAQAVSNADVIVTTTPAKTPLFNNQDLGDVKDPLIIAVSLYSLSLSLCVWVCVWVCLYVYIYIYTYP